MSDLTGKTIIITGATGGIGLVAAEKLAATNASLVLVARDRKKGDPLAARLKARIFYADLSRLDEIRRVSGELAALPRIDVLLNNAGAVFGKRYETPDGLERSFALNHMAYYLMTRLLRDRLGAGSRIINVASEAHRGVELDFNDLQSRHNYSGWPAYKRSKLANILFTRALSHRLAGTGVTANSLHPGFVATGFGNNNGGWFGPAIWLAKRFMAIPPEAGGATSVYLASSPEVEGVTGLYFDNCKPREPTEAARNDESAERLWRESARLCGLPE